MLCLLPGILLVSACVVHVLPLSSSNVREVCMTDPESKLFGCKISRISHAGKNVLVLIGTFFFSSTDRVTLVAEEHRERKVTRYCDMYSSSKVKQLFTTMHRSSNHFLLLLCEPTKMSPMRFIMAAV